MNKVEVSPHGYVILLDHFGDDNTIADSARVSYQKGTRQLRENAGLIRYLYSHKHTSPFEQVVFRFQIRMPIFVMRQWVRHRTARLNEVSGRYSELPDDVWTVQCDSGAGSAQIRAQDIKNKQSSDGLVDVPQALRAAWEENARQAHRLYRQLLELGVSRELARCHLPLSTYTEIVWQMDLHNLLHFLRLRMDSYAAQQEIREFADAVYELTKPICPVTFECFDAERSAKSTNA